MLASIDERIEGVQAGSQVGRAIARAQPALCVRLFGRVDGSVCGSVVMRAHAGLQTAKQQWSSSCDGSKE